MPEGSDGESYTVALIGNEDTNQIQITYSKIGDYHYSFSQKIAEQKPGYLYDDCTYDITVHVKYNNDNQLISETVVKNGDGMKVGVMSFKNEYDDSLVGNTETTATFNADANPAVADGQTRMQIRRHCRIPTMHRRKIKNIKDRRKRLLNEDFRRSFIF